MSDSQLPPEDLNALPPGTRFGELEVIRLLGSGGFGLVYLARDHALDRLVAIKEYMPGQLAQRQQGSQVSLRSASMLETFETGLRSFVNEARLLARFDHRSLLKVYRFWEANHTAYLAMPYLSGQTLKDWRTRQAEAPDAQWLRRMLLPLLDALGTLHAEQVYHRDIAPDNIWLPADGGDPILLDFGAARRAIADRTQSFTAILKPSFAPLEQYDGASALKQGPWTDLYALAAVVYHLLTNETPPAATRRALGEVYRPLAGRPELSAYPEPMLATVDWALALRPENRPASVLAFQEAFLGQRQAPLLPLAEPAAPTEAIQAAQPMAPAIGFEATQLIDTPRHSPLAIPVTVPLPQRPGEANDKAKAKAKGRPNSPQPGTVEAASASAGQSRKARAMHSAPVSSSANSSANSSAKPAPWRLPLLVAAVAGVAIAMLMSLASLLRGPEANLPSQAAAASEAASDVASAAGQGTTVPPLAEGESWVPQSAVVSASATAPLPTPAVLAPPRAVRPTARSEPVVAAALPPATLPAAAPTASAPQKSEPVAEANAQTNGETDPRSACGGRRFIALALCIDRQCREPAFTQHPECVRLREIREQRERDRF